ncbi:MAG: glycosyltransferase [Clostridia bacterium]|nr:glycosyltransferase [Clostridia bacterium]
MNGLVSIVMPSFNTAKLIGESIQSVLDQTYSNWELLIVDDCSTDGSAEVIAKYSDSRIKLFVNEKNSGAAVSRNKALREAKGQWIAFLDSDDLWDKEKLQKQVEFMEKNGYSFSYTGYEEIDSEGKLRGVSVSGPKRITKTGMFNYCWPGCLTVMYDATKIGCIQIENIKKNNDYAMWLKVCKKADCYLLDECLAQYRRGRVGSVSSHSKFSLIKWHYRLFRFAEHENVVMSLFNTGRNMCFGFYKKKVFFKKVNRGVR